MDGKPEDEELRLLVEQLDAKIDKTDAGVMISHGGPWPGHSLVGNRLGLLRLGVELLKAGLDLPAAPTRIVMKELEYLRTEPEASLSSVLRNDGLREILRDPEKLPTKGGWKALLMMLMGILLWALCLLVFGAGLASIGKWLIRWYYGV